MVSEMILGKKKKQLFKNSNEAILSKINKCKLNKATDVPGSSLLKEIALEDLKIFPEKLPLPNTGFVW